MNCGTGIIYIAKKKDENEGTTYEPLRYSETGRDWHWWDDIDKSLSLILWK